MYLLCRVDVGTQKDKAYKALIICKDFEKYYFLPPSREPMCVERREPSYTVGGNVN